MASITGTEQVVPFSQPGRAIESIREELTAAIAGVLDSGRFILGEQVLGFEREFADSLGASQAIGVGSGTDAIEIALRALGIGPGDEVVTQANTCVPTVAAIERAGADPVLCDVLPDTATIDPGSLEAAIGPRTAAAIPVHLYGQCADMGRIGQIASGKGLALVEDCAQAHGARFEGRPAGTIGDLGCFSFYPTKNLGALGDAGAVVTSDERLAERVNRLRQYGRVGRDQHIEAGINSRLDELQAAILRVKLPRLEPNNQRRAEIAARYEVALADSETLRPVTCLERSQHVWHLFVIRTENREDLRRRLARAGIETLVHYPYAVHQQPAYKHLAKGPVPLGNAELLAGEVVSLPLYPELTGREIGLVETALSEPSHA